LAARINGLFPWPGCYADYQAERLKVAEAYAEAEHSDRAATAIDRTATVPHRANPPLGSTEQRSDNARQIPANATAAQNPTAPAPVSPPAPAAAGTILSADKRGLRIATGSGVLRICRLQKAGGKWLPVHEFITGTPLPSGSLFTSTPMPRLTS